MENTLREDARAPEKTEGYQQQTKERDQATNGRGFAESEHLPTAQS